MNKFVLEARTRAFAVAVVRLSSAAPRNRETDVLLRQLLGSGTSIGANYREANRAESRKDFIHKIGVVEKEASETLYWLDVIIDSHILKQMDLGPLRREADELLAIFTAIGRSTKAGGGAMKVRDGGEDFGFRISDFGCGSSSLRDSRGSTSMAGESDALEPESPKPTSRSPKSRRRAKPNPKSEIRNLKSAKSEIRNPKSARSEARNPKSARLRGRE